LLAKKLAITKNIGGNNVSKLMIDGFYAVCSSRVTAVGLLDDTLKPILLARAVGGRMIPGIARDLAFQSNEMNRNSICNYSTSFLKGRE